MNWEFVKDILCVVCRPESIQKEYRLIIKQGKVVTGSQYYENGMLKIDPHYPQEAVEVAEAACKVWTPHPVFVMDIAKTDKEYKIVECGSINCAGYYACDIREIVVAMSENFENFG